MGWFPVYCSGQSVINTCHQDIQERKLPFLFFHNGKLYAGDSCLRCVWKDCRLCSPWVQVTKVSSTYLIQRLGLSGAECMASSSRFSMKRLAIMRDRGGPIGVPLICSKNHSGTGNKLISNTVQ